VHAARTEVVDDVCDDEREHEDHTCGDEKHSLIDNAERGAKALQPARRGGGLGSGQQMEERHHRHDPGDGSGRHDERQEKRKHRRWWGRRQQPDADVFMSSALAR
jgi:hypothetical protein